MNRFIWIIVLMAGALAAQDTHRDAQFVVVANPSLQGVKLTSNDLRQIYFGAKTSLNGKRVEPVFVQSGPVHERFVSTCLGKTESGLRNYFRNLVFTGKGSIPKSFVTAAAMLDYIARTPGAIGYAEVSPEGDRVTTLKLD